MINVLRSCILTLLLSVWSPPHTLRYSSRSRICRVNRMMLSRSVYFVLIFASSSSQSVQFSLSVPEKIWTHTACCRFRGERVRRRSFLLQIPSLLYETRSIHPASFPSSYSLSFEYFSRIWGHTCLYGSRCSQNTFCVVRRRRERWAVLWFMNQEANIHTERTGGEWKLEKWC